MSSAVIWLVIGMVLLGVEIFAGIVGVLFLALGALTVGALVALDIGGLNSHLTQIAAFFLFSTAWAALLWKPLKKLRNPKAEFNNIVGSKAKIITVPHGNNDGKVKWSGTIMSARFTENSTAKNVAKNDTVWVHEVENNTLIIDTTKPE